MQRRALRNRTLVILVFTHYLALVADKAAYIALLVYVFDRSGESAAATASVALVLPVLVTAPAVASLLSSNRPSRVRSKALGLQAVLTVAVAVAVARDSPPVIAVALGTLSIACTTILRPAVALLSPRAALHADELVVANIWLAYSSSISAVAAPALAAVLLLVGGPAAVLAACASLAFVAAATSVAQTSLDTEFGAMRSGRDASGSSRSKVAIADAWSEVRSRRGALAIMSVATMHYAVVATLPVLTVVLANDVLDMGADGPGTLSLFAGLGGLVSGLLAGILFKRRRLAPVILAALVVASAAHLALATVDRVAVAAAFIGVIGASRVVLDGVSRMMMQRAASPEHLGGVFALLQAATGVGGLAGALIVQALLWFGDLSAALVGVAAWFAVTAMVLAVPIFRADREATVPVVEVALLRRVGLLSHVASLDLEPMARSAVQIDRAAGEVLVAEGEQGNEFFAIVDGVCRIEVEGEVVRKLSRGDGFGEVALLADVPRTATVVADTDVSVLSIDRGAFLTAITGSIEAERSAWGEMRSLRFAAGRSPFDD